MLRWQHHASQEERRVAALIVRLDAEQYVKWSTTVDAPVSCVMTRSELVHHLESQEQVSFELAVHLLDLADATGSSDRNLDATQASLRGSGPVE
jgi:hypothetical protein